MTTSSTTVGVPVRTGASNRFAGIAGILFAIFFIAGMTLSAPDVPDADASLEEWADWATDSGNGTLALISAYLLVLAAIALVIFSVGLYHRLRAVEPDGIAPWTVLGLNVFAAAALVGGGVAINTPTVMYLFDDAPDPTDSVPIQQMISLGYGAILVGVALTMAASIAIASLALRRVTPTWFTIVGYVAAFVLLFGVVFIPMVVLPLWVLIASIMMMRSAAAALG